MTGLRAWRGLFAVALVAVFVLSLLPVPEGLMVFHWQDKLEHALAFAGLGVLASAAQFGSRPLQAFALLAYGGLIELVQAMTPHRMGDPADWLADAVGIGVAMIALRAWAPRAAP